MKHKITLSGKMVEIPITKKDENNKPICDICQFENAYKEIKNRNNVFINVCRKCEKQITD